MKALFNRFNRSKDKDKDRDKYSSSTDSPSSNHREKLDLPPLRPWPPPEHVTSTPSSFHSAKPLPDLSSRPLPPIDQSPLPITQTNSQASTESSRESAQSSLPQPISASTSSHAPSLDERTGLGLGTVTRTEAPRVEATESSGSGRGARKPTDGSTTTNASSAEAANPKKVAFISPPPTPAPLHRALSEPDTLPTNGNGEAAAVSGAGVGASGGKQSSSAPLKTNVTRFQATHGAEARGSTSTAASSSKVNVSSKNTNGNANKATVTSTRTALSPNLQKAFADTASMNASMRSNTPYSQASQSTSRILSTASWSEAAEEDLVSNLGPRERTRQEVLWEIVASEERYVTELTKLKETFIEPLLHPYASPPVTSPTPIEHDEYYARVDSPRESLDHLPIAARFLSPTPGLRPETPVTATSTTMQQPSTSTAKDSMQTIGGESGDTDDEEANDRMGRAYSGDQYSGTRRGGGSVIAAAAAKFNHPRSPYNTTGQRNKNDKAALPFPSRSHQSLPPPRRMPPQGSTASLGRQSVVGVPPERGREREVSYAATQKTDKTTGSKVLRKLRRSTTTPDILLGDAVPPHQLPEDLRRCLEVLEGGIYDGHCRLSDGLRKRYDEQYPLVRSLADVFVNNSDILREYATYVLHLERALEQVDNALSNASDTKKPKNQDAAMWMKVCKCLHRLEENAVEKGETGLAISLSKPFQRLLKYPLLFQNLLYHTDPSTFEYESTLQMVAEVETIVRSIEDEKIQKEERDKTRDAFARIEGLEKVKQLAAPKPSRLLVEERPLSPPDSPSQSGRINGQRAAPPSAINKNVKGKTSFRRLSDVLHPGQNSVGGKKDLWLVVFNDVVLRCQRTGVTSLPLVSSTNARTNSLPELQAKAKYATTGRKGMHTKPRNLYRYIKIENWAITSVADPKQGVVAMEDVARTRAEVHSTSMTGRSSLMTKDEEEEDDGNDSSDSDRKSKMSFSYWGADKVTIHKPAVKPRQASVNSRKATLSPLGYGRESSANAKFGTRLVNQDGHHPHNRPASRRTQATPTSRRPANSEDGHSAARATVTSTRPAWDGSTRAVTTTPISGRPRTRNTSQTSGVGPRVSKQSLASPAPSEDSGVGFYRQLMAKDSQLNGL